MNIVFMGTPDFAAESLKAVLAAGHDVTAVLTKPDRPRGRGMKLTSTPVKELAITRGIQCFQPETLKDDGCFDLVAKTGPDVIAVVAYGLFLPKRWLELPKLACVNVHGSLLPKYRGAAPIQRAIINGETETGVCTMHMTPAMDAGDVILSKRVKIGENETYGELYDRLKTDGAELLAETLKRIEAGGAPRMPQDAREATFAPPIGKEDALVDWTKPAKAVHDLIRGTQPAPCARSGNLRIHASRLTGTATGEPPGSVVKADNDGVLVACGDGRVLRLTAIQPPGGPRMDAAAYVNGRGAPRFT